MSQEDSDSAAKEHDASPQRLEQARKKGDIPRSTDLLAAASTSGFLLAFFTLGGWVVQRAGATGMVLLDQAAGLSNLMSSGASGPIGGLILAFGLPLLAVLVLPALVVVATLLVTKGIVFAPSKLAPKLSRISPVATARQKFGKEGLVEFAKSALKLCLVGYLLCSFLLSRADDILASLYLDAVPSSFLLARLTMQFLLLVALIAVALGGVDYIWQRHLHQERNRMSRKEMLDEFKESEGDPHMKAARRQRAQEIATNRMLADIAGADVVVVNPTHFAVALRWDRSSGRAPICVAKGVDEIAARIRERAAEHGVPMHSDPPTARAMYATVEIGQEIRLEQYRAVAAAVRFADAMRKRARQR